MKVKNEESNTIFVIIVVAALLIATIIRMKNNAEPESQEAVPEHLETAPDKAISYILQTHKELVVSQVLISCTMENLTLGLLNAPNLLYNADRWTVTVSYPFVLEPPYTVDV